MLNGGIRNYGLPDIGLCSPRHHTVRQLFKNLSLNKKMQIYAPPGSGKSSLSVLLIRYLIIIKKINVQYISCSKFLALYNEKNTEKLDLDRFKEPKVKHRQTFDQTKGFSFENSVVIIDEPHSSFHAKLHYDLATKNSSNLILCLTNQPPEEFNYKQSLETLRFNYFEFNEVLDKMIANSRFIDQQGYVNRDWFSDRVRDEIFRHTGGYPFIVFGCMRHFITNFAKTNIDSSDKDALYDQYFGLNLYNFFNVIKSTSSSRCFPLIEHIIPKLAKSLQSLPDFASTENIKQYASSLLQRCLYKLIILNPITTYIFYSDNSFSKSSYDVCLKLLIETCICAKKYNNKLNDEEFFFWNSMFRQFYSDEYMKWCSRFQLFSIETGEYFFKSNDSKIKASFVKRVVSLFSCSLLKESLTLFETQYEIFLYLSLRSLGFTSISQYNQDRNDRGILNQSYYFNI